MALRSKSGIAELILLSFAAGCSQPNESGSTSSSRLPLITVSQPFDVEAPPQTSSAMPVRAQFRCGNTRCLYVYEQLVGNTQVLLATRLTRSGVVLDTQRIRLPGAGLNTVAARGDQFLVTHYRETTTAPELTATLVDGATGALVPVTQDLGQVDFMVGDAERWYSVSFTAAGGEAVVRDAALALVGSRIRIPAGFEVASAELVAGDGQALLVAPGRALRIGSAGAALDARPIEYTRYNLGSPKAVSVAGIYYLLWANSNKLLTSRIRASDGSVLDPDDSFAQASGAKQVCHLCDSMWYGIRAVGTTPLVTWVELSSSVGAVSLVGARIDPATGRRVDGAATGAELTVASVNTQLPNVHLDGSAGFVIEPTRTVPLTVTTEPFAFTAGTALPTPYQVSFDRSAPAVASNGSVFLATWLGPNGIEASRIDEQTGEYLDDPALVVGSGGPPTVSATSDGFVVAWTWSERLMRRHISAEGVVGPRFDPLEAGPSTSMNSNSSIRLTFDGKHLLLTWLHYDPFNYTLYALRLDDKGASLDTQRRPLVTQSDAFAHFVLADPQVSESNRVFAVAYASSEGVVLRRLSSATGQLLDPVTKLASLGEFWSVNTGAEPIVSLADNRVSAYVGFHVDTVSGTRVDDPRILRPIVLEHNIEHTWFDGRSLMMLHSDVTQPVWNQLFLRRYSRVFEPLDGNVEPSFGRIDIVHDANQRSIFKIPAVGNGKGRTLLLSVYDDVERFGRAVKGRFVDNDGLPTPPSASAGAGGGGAAPGAAGGMNEAGNGGAAAQPSVAGAGSGVAGSGGTGGLPSGSAAGAHNGGAAGTAQGGHGLAVGTADSSDDGGCGCRTSTRSASARHSLLLLIGLGLMARRRRGATVRR